MKRMMFAAAAAVVLLAAPASAKDGKATDAQWMCRPAMAGEKPTAMMGTEGITCKAVPAMTPGMGPKMMPGMTAAEMDAAWRAWLEQAMQVQSASGTTGGNG